MDTQSNSTPVPTVQIGGTEILKLVYRGQQVVTFAMIDKVHKRPDETAARNFRENREHFQKDEDFFELGSDEIRRELPDGVFSKFAPGGFLLTQRGYFKITRSFKDELAWSIFDEMLDVYFAAKDGRMQVAALPLPRKLKEVGDVMQGFSRLAGLLGLKGNQRALSAAMATRRETGVDVLQLTGATHLQADVQDQFLTPTQIALRTDPASTNQKINIVLAEIGLQVEHRRKIKGKDRHDYWELTPAGKKAGGDYFDTTKKHRDGTPVKQIKWPTTVIALVQDRLSAVA